MQNLFWQRSGKKLRALEEVQFKSEDELERYVMGEAKDALNDIFILKRQVRTGSDIPDIIAVDRDNNVVVIENKNTTVDEQIVPQLLRYAIWAEKNPDSIKAMWLEAKDRPDDLKPDWDNLSIRIIILAPNIKVSVAHYVKKLNYRVDLIEVKKFSAGQDNFILLNRLDDIEDPKKKAVRGLENYDREFYLENYNPNSVKRFFDLANQIETLVKTKKWKLEKKFNKGYMGFKHGFPNVFGIEWLGSKSLGMFLKIPKARFSLIKRLCPYPCEYNDLWKHATVRIDDRFSVRSMARVFEVCYKYALER